MWTDKAAMYYSGHQRLYIFRRPSKRFYPNCLRPKFTNVPYTIVQAVFYGAEKGPLLFQNKEEWGNIIAQGFLDHIYPKLKEFYNFYNAEYNVYFPNHKFRSTLIIVQIDGAPCYRARITIAKFQKDDIKLLQWLANSPDLNLIKAVWNLIKT